MLNRTAVRRAMARKGVTVSGLARKIGSHRPDVSAWVNGRHTPTLRNAVRLAEALGCSLDDLTEDRP